MTEHEINCEQAFQQIFEYIDHELVDNERTVLEQHLHTCESCFSRTEFERKLKQKLGDLREGAEETGLRERVRSLIESFAASDPKE